MKTVIRGNQGEIMWVHYSGRTYVTPADRDLIERTEVTNDMITKFDNQPTVCLRLILNGHYDAKDIKLEVLKCNGFDIITKTV